MLPALLHMHKTIPVVLLSLSCSSVYTPNPRHAYLCRHDVLDVMISCYSQVDALLLTFAFATHLILLPLHAHFAGFVQEKDDQAHY